MCTGVDLDVLVWGGGGGGDLHSGRSRNQKDSDKIQTPLGGSGGMCPQEIFDIFML